MRIDRPRQHRIHIQKSPQLGVIPGHTQWGDAVDRALASLAGDGGEAALPVTCRGVGDVAEGDVP
jgi:hypothetical protein